MTAFSLKNMGHSLIFVLWTLKSALKSCLCLWAELFGFPSKIFLYYLGN